MEHDIWIGKTKSSGTNVAGVRRSTTACGCKTCGKREVFSTRRQATQWVNDHKEENKMAAVETYKVQLVRVSDGTVVAETDNDVEPSLTLDADGKIVAYFNGAQHEQLGEMAVAGFQAEMDSGKLDVEALERMQRERQAAFEASWAKYR